MPLLSPLPAPRARRLPLAVLAALCAGPSLSACRPAADGAATSSAGSSAAGSGTGSGAGVWRDVGSTPPPRVGHTWSMRRDERGVTLELVADSVVPDTPAGMRPALSLRCLGGATTEAYLTILDHPAEARPGVAPVRVTVDGAPAVAADWRLHPNGLALFAPDPIALARRLGGARGARVAFTSEGIGPAVAFFDVAGLERLLPELAGACRWPAEAPR